MKERQDEIEELPKRPSTREPVHQHAKWWM